MNAANKLVLNRRALKTALFVHQGSHPLVPMEWREELNCPFFRDEWILKSQIGNNQFSDVQMIERLNTIQQGMPIGDSDVDNDEDEELDEVGTPPEYQEGLSSESESDDGSGIEEEYPHTEGPSRTYSLLSFGETRWYSAWCVMLRFYSLFDALTALKSDCETNPYLYRSGGDEFVANMTRIRKEELFLVLHYLRPLVEAIDFFQSDRTTSWDVFPLLVELRDFYVDHSVSDGMDENQDPILNIQRSMVEAAFRSRMALFERPYSLLNQLFTDEFARLLPMDTTVEDSRVESFGDRLVEELQRYYASSTSTNLDELINQTVDEARRFIVQYRRRVGIRMATYIGQHSNAFPHLKKLFEDLSSRPSSSASVERSFSVQGCFLLPRRNNMTLQTLKELMIIRMNCLLAEKHGWLPQLEDYIDHRSVKLSKKQN